MKNKILFKIMTLALATATLFTVTACGGGGNGGGGSSVDDANTLNVRIRKTGYGTDYISALAEEFEKTFASEGYKINLLSPREDLASANVYRDIYSNSGIDVYFGSDFDAELAVSGEYGQVFADITDSVYNQKPIKFDGTEEELTIAQKLNAIKTPDGVYNDRVYGIPFALAFGGLAVNKAVLDEYDLELPRTTNEMFECADVIMSHANDTGVFPFTYSLSGNNYPLSTVAGWMAQYGGIEEFNSFWSFNNSETGESLGDKCYEVFGTQSLTEMMETLYHFYDYNMAAYGSGQQDFSAAQGKIMKGEAVFYSVGSWFLNEEYDRFNKFINDVTFINTPVVSSLGTKLFGAGTAYNYDDEKCELVLTTILKYADENKLADEVETLVEAELSLQLESQDVLIVCQRRGYVKNSTFAELVVSEKSQKKDLAATFLRFCASTEAGEVFAQTSRVSSPYAMDSTAHNDIPFIASVNKIKSNPYFEQLHCVVNGYRKELGLITTFPYMGDIFASKVYDTSVSKYDDDSLAMIKDNSVYEIKAQELVSAMYQSAKSNIENKVWKPLIK